MKQSCYSTIVCHEWNWIPGCGILSAAPNFTRHPGYWIALQNALGKDGLILHMIGSSMLVLDEMPQPFNLMSWSLPNVLNSECSRHTVQPMILGQCIFLILYRVQCVNFNMHICLLCFYWYAWSITSLWPMWIISQYSPGLLHWQWIDHSIVPIPVK